jgi:hypothetical protein
MRTLVRGCGKAAHMDTEENKKPNGEGPKPLEHFLAKVAKEQKKTCGCWRNAKKTSSMGYR